MSGSAHRSAERLKSLPHHSLNRCGVPDAPNTAKLRMNEMTCVPPSSAAATM